MRVTGRGLVATAAVLLGAFVGRGAAFDGIYRDPAPVAAMFRGYDLVTLVVVVPLLAVTLLPRAPRSATAVMLAGLLTQLAYMVALASQVRAGIPDAAPFDPAEPANVADYALGAWLLWPRASTRRAAPRESGDRPDVAAPARTPTSWG